MNSMRLTPALSDQLLTLAPINLLLFNEELVCDYAAPVGDVLLGRARDDLVGRSADDILPPARDGLKPALHQAAAGARGWATPHFRFSYDHDGGIRQCCWSIQVNPVRTRRYRGVLVSWQDADRQAEENSALRTALNACEEEARARDEAAIMLFSDLRNAITPLSGYLQLIVRRPLMLRGRSPADVISALVLPRLADVLSAIDHLRQPPLAVPIRERAWRDSCSEQERSPRG